MEIGATAGGRFYTKHSRGSQTFPPIKRNTPSMETSTVAGPASAGIRTNSDEVRVTDSRLTGAFDERGSGFPHPQLLGIPGDGIPISGTRDKESGDGVGTQTAGRGRGAAGGGDHFRVWAPARNQVEVVVEGGPVSRLEPETGGYFSGFLREASAGTRYRFRLDGGHQLYPDPASRFQPDGPHGPSQVVDPAAFTWTDADWPGVPATGAGALRAAHRHVHPGGDVGGGRPATARAGGRAASPAWR